jgi:hypothetical protein
VVFDEAMVTAAKDLDRLVQARELMRHIMAKTHPNSKLPLWWT